MTRTRAVRVGNCSGFYGDRLAALAEMVGGGELDVVTGDYLAEVTMLVLAKVRMRKPNGGYAASFLRQLEPVAGEIADRGIKVVVNAGGLDPGGLADAVRALVASAGVELEVAHVEGDDLTGRITELLEGGQGLHHLDSGARFSSWGREVLTANAYLGGFGIKNALDGGADIVVTGRVADASLVTGAAAWWWGWEATDFDRLAGALVAGHVIECGAQATGGNYSGFGEIEDLVHPGFPLAEISEDGSSVITKHAGTGGAVTVGTVTAQLLYEIGPPGYLNPDVVAHLDTVRLEDDGRDRVRIGPVAGSPPPPTTKVAITSLGGWQNSCTVLLTGLDTETKAAVFEAAVRSALAGQTGIRDLRFTRIGAAGDDPDDQMLGTCVLNVSVQGDEASAGRAFSSAVVELALANFPGIYFTSAPGGGAAYGAYWPALVPQHLVPHTVVRADGRRQPVPPPVVVADAAAGPLPPTVVAGAAAGPAVSEPRALAEDFGPTVVAPLGRIVQARSGDKGGNANLGLWVKNPEAWSWLAATMTVDRLRALLPEIAQLSVDRYELANLNAVNFVIHGLLDGGATEARRYDKQAKALGEWVRARRVALPERFLSA